MNIRRMIRRRIDAMRDTFTLTRLALSLLRSIVRRDVLNHANQHNNRPQ